MESLTRNNYEIWFLDYLDGQLSNEQLETLLDFLEENPDLKEELRGASGINLTAGEEVLSAKDLLLKSPADIPGISTLDQLCIARMENDLTVEESDRFDQRLTEDQELSANYAAFRNTRLQAAKPVAYPNKNELKKKTVILSPWLITAISSAAIIMLAWILWPDAQETVAPTMAKTENPVDVKTPPVTIVQQPVGGSRQTLAENRKPVKQNSKQEVNRAVNQVVVTKESPVRESSPMTRLTHKSAVSGPRIPDPQSIRMLYASNFTLPGESPLTTDDALTLPQYALQLFRERVLGEERTLVRRTRFTLWEVAGAGVNKINSLAGTKMKLNREYDAKGDLLAVSFNSRLIDVESPVRSQAAR